MRLQASFTELGTLEVSCESATSPHRWRLQFELRGDAGATGPAESDSLPASSSAAPAMVQGDAVYAASNAVRSVFTKGSAESSVAPENLVSNLETILGMKRDNWPTAVARRLSDTLISAAEGRKQSPQHEMRWLSLVGFCLRPGFGAPEDERRVAHIRKLSLSGPAFEHDVQSEVQSLVLLRRIAGGLNASAQHELYRKLLPGLNLGSKKKRGRRNPQIEYETWRVVANLEQLPANLRVPLGDELAARIVDDSRWLWPLGRVGARIPLYGPLMCVVPAEKASEWLDKLVALPDMSAETVHAIVEVARNTGDRARDVSADVRSRAVRALRDSGAEQIWIEPLQKFVAPGRRDAVRMFGESLPSDLQVVSSANCLLSVAALNPEPGRAA